MSATDIPPDIVADNSPSASESDLTDQQPPQQQKAFHFRGVTHRYVVELDPSSWPHGWNSSLMQSVWCHVAGRSIIKQSNGNTNSQLELWFNHQFPCKSRRLTGAGVRSRIQAEIADPVSGFFLRSSHTIETADSRRRRRQRRRQHNRKLRQQALQQAVYDVACSSLGTVQKRHQLARQLVEQSDMTHAEQQNVKASNPVNLRHVYRQIHQLAKDAGAPLGDSDIEQADTRKVKDENGLIIPDSHGKMVNKVCTVVKYLLQKLNVSINDVLVSELVLWGDGVMYGHSEVTGISFINVFSSTLESL